MAQCLDDLLTTTAALSLAKKPEKFNSPTWAVGLQAYIDGRMARTDMISLPRHPSYMKSRPPTAVLPTYEVFEERPLPDRALYNPPPHLD